MEPGIAWNFVFSFVYKPCVKVDVVAGSLSCACHGLK